MPVIKISYTDTNNAIHSDTFGEPTAKSINHAVKMAFETWLETCKSEPKDVIKIEVIAK